MRILFTCFIAILMMSCSSTNYYVVRHAERVNSPSMSVDVPLTESGKLRAEALKSELRNAHISHIYSTNYNRTKATVQPLASYHDIPIKLYDPRDTSFISKVKGMGKGNFLIVGHSNTVDDIVNQLAGSRQINGDLPDTQYGDLFVVRKKGNKTTVEKKRYGQ